MSLVESVSVDPRTNWSLGPVVGKWAEENLVHGEGDNFGRPWKLRPWQKVLLNEAFRLYPNGQRVWRRVEILVGSGNGKTELGGLIGAAEFCGPVMFNGVDKKGRPVGTHRISPDIPVAATSFDQANLLFGATTLALKGGKLAPAIKFQDTEITFVDPETRPGRMYRVAAVAGSNEGLRPTAFLRDELHEWKAKGRRVNTVISKGMAKRSNATMWGFSTAGIPDENSLAEDAHKLYLGLRDGTIAMTDVLVINYEASRHWDLDDPEQLLAAIKEANPAAGDFLSIENIVAKFWDPGMPRLDFRRYHLNQWEEAPVECWLNDRPGAWGRCQANIPFPEQMSDEVEQVTAGVDMALRNDSMALVLLAKLKNGRKVVKSRVWEAPDNGTLPHGEMRQALRDYSVIFPEMRVAYDPRFFTMMAQDLEEEGLLMIEIPQVEAYMSPACKALYEAICSKEIAHDGDPVLNKHVHNAVRRDGERGWTLSKRKSTGKIDACIALALANSEMDIPKEDGTFTTGLLYSF